MEIGKKPTNLVFVNTSSSVRGTINHILKRHCEGGVLSLWGPPLLQNIEKFSLNFYFDIFRYVPKSRDYIRDPVYPSPSQQHRHWLVLFYPGLLLDYFQVSLSLYIKMLMLLCKGRWLQTLGQGAVLWVPFRDTGTAYPALLTSPHCMNRANPLPGLWTEERWPPSARPPQPSLGTELLTGLGISPWRMHVLGAPEWSGLLVQMAGVWPGGRSIAIGWVWGLHPRRAALVGAATAEPSRCWLRSLVGLAALQVAEEEGRHP